ncbi:MAG: 50S ribosomal protein L4 [Actinomycetota bacterium]
MGKSITVHDKTGKKVSEVAVSDAAMKYEANPALVHQVVNAYLAGLRQGSANTKTRGEVSGGGVKPWRQKGTGRARAGSIRSPIWRHGGIVHGPKPRDFSQKVPKKMKYAALKGALADKLRDGSFKVVEELTWEKPSTKAAVELLAALKAEGKVLAVVQDEQDAIMKSFRNLPHVKVVSAGQLTTYDVLNADDIVTTKSVFELVAKERLV